MRSITRQAIFATTAFIGLASFTALAAPPATVVHSNPFVTLAANPADARPAPQGMTHRVEQRITELHKKLQITVAQQKPWDDFTNAMRANAVRMDANYQRRVDSMGTMKADESMANYAQVASEHAADMQSLVPLFETLYTTMSDSQKALADNVFRADAHRGDKQKHG